MIKKKQKEQELILEKLRPTPVVTIACKLTGVSRATFYRWMQADERFAHAVDDAMHESLGTVTDMAESNVIGHIKKGDIGTSKYWLKYHHQTYGAKVTIRKTTRGLGSKDKLLIRKAMKMMSG